MSYVCEVNHENSAEFTNNSAWLARIKIKDIANCSTWVIARNRDFACAYILSQEPERMIKKGKVGESVTQLGDTTTR